MSVQIGDSKLNGRQRRQYLLRQPKPVNRRRHSPRPNWLFLPPRIFDNPPHAPPFAGLNDVDVPP